MKLLVLTFCLIVLRCSTAEEPSKSRNFVDDSRKYVVKEAMDVGNFFFNRSGLEGVRTKDETVDTRIIRETTAKNGTIEQRNFFDDSWIYFEKEASDFEPAQKRIRRETAAVVDDSWKYVDKEATDFGNVQFRRSVPPDEQTNEETVDTRIMGGTPARDSQFPYQTLLSYGDDPYCAASIIHERWALTARHCILENETDTAYITVGTIRLDKVGGVNIPVDQFIPHPEYNYKPKEQNNGLEYVVNDIGLIHLKQPIQFTKKASPIALPPPELANLGGRIGVIAGWGKTAKANSSEFLQTAHVRLLDRKTCERYWTYVRDVHFCTLMVERKSVCLGDSGGALVIDGRQYGIISTANDNCRWTKPNLYTDVSAYVRWVQAEIEIFGDTLPFNKNK